MRKSVWLAVAASVSAFAVNEAALHCASAADMPLPQGEAQMLPPPAYENAPPAEESYAYPPPPPPVVYGYPPPLGYAYIAPPVIVLPGPYGVRPYERFYGPRFARGYGRWDHRYHRW